MVYAIVGFMVAMDLTVVWVLLASFRSGHWEPLERAFPAVEVLPGAVRRDFQSFSFGLNNLGYCVHVAADERHLHLMPARLLRWVGCGPMSLPWEAIESVKAGGERWRTVRVGKQEFRGPAWCLELAGPPAGSEGG